MSELIEELRELYEGGGYHSWLNLTIERATEGRVTASIPHDEKYTGVGPATAIHGGVLATLADVTAGAAIRTTHEDPKAWTQVTTTLDIAYLKPGTSDVEAVANVAHSGSSSGVATVECRCDSDRDRIDVAVATVTCRLFREDS